MPSKDLPSRSRRDPQMARDYVDDALRVAAPLIYVLPFAAYRAPLLHV